MIFRSMTPDRYYSRHTNRDLLTIKEAFLGLVYAAILVGLAMGAAHWWGI